MALRAVPLTVPTLDALGLPSILKELSDLKRGLVLVTGPTGSGKSTTLAAMINHINLTRNANVLTLEDPIEYLHHHEQAMINQRELGSDTKSYANALKSALRQGPDVILIGELNDIDTISTALTAAETGHLVLSTLHTSGVVGTIERLIEVFPQERQQQVRVQLSEVLQGVVSQQLFRRFENDGRVAAMEIMICNPAIRNHIKEGKTHQIINSIQTDKKEGMVLMDFALAELYKGKLISYEDAMAHVMDKDCLTKI